MVSDAYTKISFTVRNNASCSGSLAPGRKGQCSVCQKSAGIIEINRSMRPDLLCMFRSPKDLLVEYANKVKGTMDFQNAQRERLIKQLQNRVCKFLWMVRVQVIAYK